MPRPSFVVLLALCALPVAGLGCRPAPSTAECRQMLRRYLDMTMGPELAQGDLTPAQADSVRERAVSLRMDEPVFARTEAQCMAEVSRSEYDCAIEAPNANEWESCIE